MHLLPLRPDPTVLCCICVGSLGLARLCCLVGGSVSERSQGSRLVETAGLPMGLPSSSASSSFSLIQSQESPASVHWLGIIICISFNCLLGHSESSHAKFLSISTSVIVSGLGACVIIVPAKCKASSYVPVLNGNCLS